MSDENRRHGFIAVHHDNAVGTRDRITPAPPGERGVGRYLRGEHDFLACNKIVLTLGSAIDAAVSTRDGSDGGAF